MSQPAKKKINKNKDSKKQKQIKKCILEKTIKKPLKTTRNFTAAGAYDALCERKQSNQEPQNY